jgi:uncharacterized membrane protein
MRTRLKLFGHPIHPMLVVFPVGMFITSVIFDILFLTTRNLEFCAAAFYMIVAGILGGLVAAIFGVIDWFSLPFNSRAWNIGIWHGIGNIFITMLFVLNWLQRRASPEFVPNSSMLFLSFLGVVLLLITAWMGGELIYRLGVTVDPGANPNAPNSITTASPTPGTRQSRVEK